MFIAHMDEVQTKLKKLGMEKESVEGILKRYKEIGLPNWCVGFDIFGLQRVAGLAFFFLGGHFDCFASHQDNHSIFRLVDTTAVFHLDNMVKDLVKVIALLNPIQMRDVSFPSLTTCSAVRLMETHTVSRFFPRD